MPVCLSFWVVPDSAFFFVRNKSGGRRARSLSEKRAGFCTGSFTAEAPGLRTIVVMKKDESKIDVFSWFKGNFFFHRLNQLAERLLATNLLFPLFFSFFVFLVLCCFTSSVSSTLSESPFSIIRTIWHMVAWCARSRDLSSKPGRVLCCIFKQKT